MQKSSNNTARYNQLRFKRLFKRKVFLSNELKKSLLMSIIEAKNLGIYVNLDLFLYGLLSQPTALSSRLFTLALRQFKNNTKLTTTVVSNRVYEHTIILIKNKLRNNFLEYSINLDGDNQHKPWLSTEIRDILKQGIINSLQTRRKINIVTTKHMFLELLNKEDTRDFLRKVLN